MSEVTDSRNSPFSSQSDGVPSAKTSVPSAGGFPAFSAFCRHMQQRTWLFASRSVKYQWPLE